MATRTGIRPTVARLHPGIEQLLERLASLDRFGLHGVAQENRPGTVRLDEVHRVEQLRAGIAPVSSMNTLVLLSGYFVLRLHAQLITRRIATSLSRLENSCHLSAERARWRDVGHCPAN